MNKLTIVRNFQDVRFENTVLMLGVAIGASGVGSMSSSNQCSNSKDTERIHIILW